MREFIPRSSGSAVWLRLSERFALGSRCVVPARPIPSASYEVSVRRLMALPLRGLRLGFALMGASR